MITNYGFHTNNNTESLLDAGPQYKQGIYDAKVQEPEHSNGGNPALRELPALQVGHLLDLVLFVLFFLASYRST